MSKINTIQLIEKQRGNIKKGYNMRLDHLEDIIDSGNCDMERIQNAFIFGYAQGVKAAKVKTAPGL